MILPQTSSLLLLGIGEQRSLLVSNHLYRRGLHCYAMLLLMRRGSHRLRESSCLLMTLHMLLKGIAVLMVDLLPKLTDDRGSFPTLELLIVLR